ncbi:MAG: hypothetical protein FWD93_04935 [Coriobacteriia bacterium]|nr:hypothetical protein [Coriobacteriia bacterium]
MTTDSLQECMENEALQLMSHKYPFLLDQLKDVAVVKREFTGVGFYTDFHVNGKVANEVNMPLSGVGGRLNDSVDIGLVLFITKGKIDCLEGYTYGGELWPEHVRSYSVFEIEFSTDGRTGGHAAE